MKKIISVFIILLASTSLWAQSQTRTEKLNPESDPNMKKGLLPGATMEMSLDILYEGFDPNQVYSMTSDTETPFTSSGEAKASGKSGSKRSSGSGSSN